MPLPLRGSELDFLTQVIDYASSTVNYYGYAVVGTSQTASTGWLIKRQTLDSSGRTTAIEFARGIADFVNAWSSRASYTYS